MALCNTAPFLLNRPTSARPVIAPRTVNVIRWLVTGISWNRADATSAPLDEMRGDLRISQNRETKRKGRTITIDNPVRFNHALWILYFLDMYSDGLLERWRADQSVVYICFSHRDSSLIVDVENVQGSSETFQTGWPSGVKCPAQQRWHLSHNAENGS